MTLLLGPPSYGKTTLLLALVDIPISYCFKSYVDDHNSLISNFLLLINCSFRDELRIVIMAWKNLYHREHQHT